MESSKPHAVLLPSPGANLLNRCLELGNRLAAGHNFHVTVFVVYESHASADESQLIQLAVAQKLLDIVELPPVEIAGKVEPNAGFIARLTTVMSEIRPTLRVAISALKHNPTALIVDFFGTGIMDVADEFHMLKYVFVSSALPIALTLYAPILYSNKYVDQKEPLMLPGGMPVRLEDLFDPLVDRTTQEYKLFLQVGSEMRKSDGILVNTWEDLEATTLKALREEEGYGSVPVYAVGPPIRPVEAPTSRSYLLDWLDEQPIESVLYIAIRSIGVELSAEQIAELAWGLELSQQRFIWVLRPPSIKDASADRGDEDDDACLEYLPDGFLARTQSMGRVVTKWAPHVEILAHGSTGGFLSHCGWNSSLESILNGVPMIVWPLFAEQKLNSTKLSEELEVAVRPKTAPTKGVVGREEIEMMVRKVMEGREGKAMRARINELKIRGVKASSEGGSSFNAMSQLAKLCVKNSQPQAVTSPSDR